MPEDKKAWRIRGMTSTTTVVNKLHEPFDVYIGRGSIFGNPMRIGAKVDSKPYPVNREEAIIWYKEYFYNRLKTSDEFKRAVETLRGKRLGCFCKPLACHGDIIKEYLDNVIC